MNRINLLITINEDKLRDLLSLQYGVNPGILDKSVWGYNTVGYYVREGDKAYIMKATPFNPDKAAKCEKDVQLSILLSNYLPTPTYLRNKDGAYLTVDMDHIFRVAVYVEGTSPFEMDLAIYRQMLVMLGTIHGLPKDVYENEADRLRLRILDDGKSLLHGDPTPSNFIVADGKTVEILDFEDALIGPVEYDLARAAVFSWFRMKNVPFNELCSVTFKDYGTEFDHGKFLKFCLDHASNHLDKVIANKDKYDDMVFWQDDYNFSSRALEEIRSVVTVPGY